MTKFTISKLAEYERMIPNAMLSPHELCFTHCVNLVEWEETGREIAAMAQFLPFWLGDWVNYGKMFDHRDVVKTMVGIGMPTTGISKYVRTAAAFEPDRRNVDVPYQFHEVIGEQPAPLRPGLLRMAEKSDSLRTFRRAHLRKDKRL